MTFIQKTLILHFLKMLKNHAEREQLKPVNKTFLEVLSRTTLLSIIDQMTGKGRHPDDPDFSALSNEALLKWIADQYYILDYIIQELEESIRL